MRTSVPNLPAGTAAMIPAASAATAADLPAPAGRSIITAVSLFTRTGFGVGPDAGYGWQCRNDNSKSVPDGSFIGTGITPAGTVLPVYATVSGNDFRFARAKLDFKFSA